MEEFFRRKFFGNFSGGFFWRNFLGGIFLADIFGRIFLGGFFWENFLEESFVYIGIDFFVKILIFVKILSQWRRKEEEGGKNLDP